MSYLILERIVRKAEDGTSDIKGGPLWREADSNVSASSAEAAVRNYVTTSGTTGGVYLAIPERSAKTIRVKVETVQKVSVDAGEEKE